MQGVWTPMVKVRDNSGVYSIPNVVYGVGYRKKGEPKDEPIFLTWKTAFYEEALLLIEDIKSGLRARDGYGEIALVKITIDEVKINGD